MLLFMLRRSALFRIVQGEAVSEGVGGELIMAGSSVRVPPLLSNEPITWVLGPCRFSGEALTHSTIRSYRDP